MKKKNHTSNINRYILLGLSAFCVLMMLLSSFSDKVGGPFKVLANVTVIPLQQGINQIGGWMGDMKDNFSTLKQLQAENEKLQEQIDALTTENNYLQEERYEYERLQELYKLDQNYADYEKTAAHVIGKESGNWFSTFTIDKGSNDGIAVDMNVLAGSGLVGIVTDCIVSGDLSLMNTGQISFDQMENNDNTVSVGDQIVTSYISDKYLQGILIGSVSEINVDSNNLTRSGYITPAVDFRNIQEVLVITTTKAELTGEDQEE